ncbi:CMRF35-like molecule 7 [Cynocephalus volans]|uniref:CMRF35-like molecule 7 n=1 Tax=Cynocephalus volans TaxID=110931 RepID=UPI002FCBEFBD
MWLPPALFLLSLPGCFSIQGPKSVRAREQGSVTVQCHYNPGWETYKKWWCRGKIWRFCNILIQTRGSEQEEKSDRVSIRDNHRDHSFSVTMKGLRRDDTDTYWCGIERTGTDCGTQVKVTVDPGKSFLIYAVALVTGTEKGPDCCVSSHRTHYMLLVFVKVPILLIMAGAVLWLKGSQKVSEEQYQQPVHTNLSSELPTKDIAP